MVRSINFVFLTIAVLLLSGCFAVKSQYRDQLVLGLTASTWPIPSGVYSKLTVGSNKVQENFRTIRRKVVRGQRIYVVDGKVDEIFVFYPQGNDLYVLEQHDPTGGDDFASVFTYVYVDPASGGVGSFENQCGDLSASQRSSLFGSADATTCLVRTAHGSLSNLGLGGLIDMLNLSMRAKGEVQAVYQLQRTVTDALQ